MDLIWLGAAFHFTSLHLSGPRRCRRTFRTTLPCGVGADVMGDVRGVYPHPHLSLPQLTLSRAAAPERWHGGTGPPPPDI